MGPFDKEIVTSFLHDCCSKLSVCLPSRPSASVMAGSQIGPFAAIPGISGWKVHPAGVAVNMWREEHCFVSTVLEENWRTLFSIAFLV